MDSMISSCPEYKKEQALTAARIYRENPTRNNFVQAKNAVDINLCLTRGYVEDFGCHAACEHRRLLTKHEPMKKMGEWLDRLPSPPMGTKSYSEYIRQCLKEA